MRICDHIEGEPDDNIVVHVEGLGKRYKLGQLLPYNTLGEALMRPFHRAQSRAQSDLAYRKLEGSNQYIWALRNVSFDIKRGDVIGIIGRNGAGKSTLLKILTRITEPTEGYADVDGRLGSLIDVKTGLHLELTGRENVYFTGAILGMKKTEIERKFNEIVAFAEVESFIDTPLKRYSDGMKVRLGFAVAAYLETDILLVDEALAVGDGKFQKKCLGKMNEIARNGHTILFVSHQMDLIRTLCDRCIWLDIGSVQMFDTTQKVVSAYESTSGRLPSVEEWNIRQGNRP